MNTHAAHISMLEKAILEVLAYTHIFNHPLNRSEIFLRLSVKHVDASTFDDSINRLTTSGAIQHSNGFYFLKNSASIIDERKAGELRAKKLMRTAKRMSGIIYWFPFVRGVFVSGSLSKGVIPKDADIDYFIITKRNRLWIARTLLVVFKRLFLFGSKKYFCVNYFVDEGNLEIPDKNVFTATEVSTIIPLKGTQYCEQFIAKNDWYKNFYPNINLPKMPVSNPGLMKNFSMLILEPLFFNSLAEKLDKDFMKRTYKRWTNMYGQGYSDTEFELAFRSKRGTSKNHDKNYQSRVLKAVEENVTRALEGVKTETINA